MCTLVAVGFLCAVTAHPALAQQPAAPPPRVQDKAVAEGIALLQQNRLAEARARLQRAVELHPDSVDAHYMLGWLSEQERDLAGAAAAYETALRHAPRRAEIHDRLGFVRGEQGRTA